MNDSKELPLPNNTDAPCPSRCYRATGLTVEEAEQGLRKLSEAAAKVPFPTRDELRLSLMGAYRREWGILRFFHPGWWDAFLSR